MGDQHDTLSELKKQKKEMIFPKDFTWGVASSSFQIEGATREDGRGPSIWDTFCLTPGRIADRSNGDIACDHYHLWEKDLDLMVELGIKAYRFSIAWPRIFPEGRGKVEERGLDFYKRLVDGMLRRGLEPWATLYHWDLPQSLQNTGGWLDRKTAEAFADYAEVVVGALKDRVGHWITLNEPWCSAVLSHRIGEHAPGFQDGSYAVRAAHHLLLAHGLAMPRMRALAPHAKHGITLNLTPAVVMGQSSQDQKEGRIFDGDFNRWYLDPVLKGFYPEDMKRHYEAQGYVRPEDGGWSFIKDGDLKIIQAPNDFLGVNFYTRSVFGRHRTSEEEKKLLADPTQYTAMGWEICPDDLENLFVRLHREYPCPAYYITENGAAFEDKLTGEGRVHDLHRVQYYQDHLRRVYQCTTRGIPLKGYFAWSIMDNFEWAHGYAKRFGLIYVDYTNQKRFPKDSYYFYQKVARTNSL